MPARPSSRTFAFTLIELLTVVALLVILASVAIGSLRGSKQQAMIVRARAELASLSTSLENYKRAYGDYPQLGEFAHAALAPTNSATGPGLNTAEAKLFNCLTGVYGPRGFTNSDRISGPNLLEGSPLLDVHGGSLNGTLTASFLVPVANAPQPPYKPEQNVSLVDPWGRRYLYYYKNRQNPAAWQAPSYLLYSVGPDGAHQTPPANGVLTATQLTAASNADNLNANP